MKERPIIMSAESVRAILARKKAQTRRVIKPQPDNIAYADQVYAEYYNPYRQKYCPYGVPGDRLWVKETWHPAGRIGTEYLVEYKADEESLVMDAGLEGPTPSIDAMTQKGWRSPIYMPRWASRLTLEVRDVRGQLLHDMDNTDFWAEGIADEQAEEADDPWITFYRRYELPYIKHWDFLNAKRGFPWKSNPGVWAITFERIEQG